MIDRFLANIHVLILFITILFVASRLCIVSTFTIQVGYIMLI